MKNAFCFTSKAFFVLKIFKFLSWLFHHVLKRLDKKDNVNFKCHDVTAWLANICNTHITQYLEKQSRHFSHVTKTHSFKNLNLSKKPDHSFCGNCLKNYFRHLKLYSNPRSWLVRNRCHMDLHWKKKDWANLSGFCTWKFTAREDLNLWKQVFLLNLRHWPSQNLKIWSILYRRIFI